MGGTPRRRGHAVSRLRDWLREERHQQSRLVAATALLAFVVGYAAATAVILLGRSGEGIGAAAESMRLRADNRRLARELSQLRTDTQVDREAYAGVGRQMEALQEQVLDLQEEVAFYRGIVGGGSGPGLQVKDFALAAGPATQGWRATAHDEHLRPAVELDARA